jgi:hypothetical protein
MSASDYWEYANSDLIKDPGTCNKCEDSDVSREDPPAAAPPTIEWIYVCTNCSAVVDAE